MKIASQRTSTPTPITPIDANKATMPTGGLPMRTDLRAGLAWDDLDDKAQELFNNLTNTLSGLLGGNDASS